MKSAAALVEKKNVYNMNTLYYSCMCVQVLYLFSENDQLKWNKIECITCSKAILVSGILYLLNAYSSAKNIHYLMERKAIARGKKQISKHVSFKQEWIQ